MNFPIREYGRLDGASKVAVENWVVDHLGTYRDVSDVGVNGNVAWFRRFLRNTDGDYYIDPETEDAASEVWRAPLKRPFPTGLQRVPVDDDVSA